jgi:ketosteroid isomerase-like protein
LHRCVVLFLLAACSASSSGGTPYADTMSTAELRESVMQADRDFNTDFATRRIEGWVSWFDTAGVQVTSEGDVPKGHDEIRAHMVKAFPDTAQILAWRPVSAELSADGSMGYTIGTWDFHRRGKDSAASAATGHYLTVWRRQADNSWKVLADIGTTHPKKR